MKNPKFIYSLLALVGVLFTGLLADWTISSVIHSKQEIIMPLVTGKSAAEALDILSKNGFGMKKTGQEFNSDLPVGTITRQEPPAGMTVREGRIVKVTLSQGSDLVFVPAVTGEPLRKAELFIRQARLSVGVRTDLYSLRYEKDSIIAQSPEANTAVNKDTPVNLSVSLGAPTDGTILMPNFVGKSVSEAKAWCESKSVGYGITEEFQAALPGTVVSQSPSPDTVIFGSMTANIVVAALGNATERRAFGQAVHYEVPQGGTQQRVRIVLIDSDGEKEIFSELQAPGSKVDLTVPAKGRAKLRFFINNILTEERDLQ